MRPNVIDNTTNPSTMEAEAGVSAACSRSYLSVKEEKLHASYN